MMIEKYQTKHETDVYSDDVTTYEVKSVKINKNITIIKNAHGDYAEIEIHPHLDRGWESKCRTINTFIEKIDGLGDYLDNFDDVDIEADLAHFKNEKGQTCTRYLDDPHISIAVDYEDEEELDQIVENIIEFF